MSSGEQEKPVPYYLRPNKLQREMNKAMAQMIPELDSEYARTPMARNRWNAPSETLDDGTPCFLPADKETGKRQDYIWMPKIKDLPSGYYHLATQEAYIQINLRLRKHRPGLFRRRNSCNVDKKMYKQIRNIMQNRIICDVPDDAHAQRLKLLGLQSQGGQAAAFGKAAYLPTLTSAFLVGVGN